MSSIPYSVRSSELNHLRLALDLKSKPLKVAQDEAQEQVRRDRGLGSAARCRHMLEPLGLCRVRETGAGTCWNRVYVAAAGPR